MMALRKYKPSGDASSLDMVPLNFPKKAQESSQLEDPEMNAGPSVSEADVDIDLREVYFLIMHFLSAGPCQRTYGQFWNELLEHQLLPRRYHAWYSRSGERSGDENDNGISFPLGYNKLVERYPHIQKDHLIKLLKSLILSCSPPSHGMFGGKTPNAGDVPTLLGSGSFSLLGFDRDKEDEKAIQLPRYLRWPHMQADQVRGISLREIGGGFTKHHRAPSVRAACYAIAKPSTMVQKMQFTKKLRGHQNAVYCAIFDRTGRYVITGSDDRLVKIWSMETAFCLSSCRGHEGDITDLAVSSNNALVASASNDFIIRVWRLPDGLPISVLRGHTGAVTAIAFSPRPSAVYQLLSSSDDGTCRIWDARYSQSPPRIYIPKPPDVVPGKGYDPSKNVGPVVHQILCCAYNASGTVFVTGSSDTFARVWNACKSNAEESEQPYHEMDLLSGHENDVNYVQFSGCAVASRSSPADGLKEDNIPKFKNSWFSHDNIVTCSRDGSAIIWIPRSRRSHGKVGRWTRAYHLKVPPPPMPPQPPRGGPRQRYQPTPRGVNMIVWSLDNRFVLAAIMDHRICVWNAADGSLVHSLIGHSLYTFVLDVHPFNPRIAMSAGYDGKTIIWDIWEGTPVRIYETGHFRLVDGKFSPDGTSIVLSDEVGQVFIITTGQGESQKDAQYDQFFLGDYRPLIHDTQGNVLDQETQLAPYRRNMQDFLCDSSMIPYPEPYQSMYQQRRLGALGIEWRPPSLNFAVGPAHNINHDGHDVQLLPFIDLDRVAEPLPEFLDAIDWEPENEIQSDDTDSEYNVTDECSSEGERESLCFSSSGDPECSAEDSEFGHDNKEGLRRSKRKKHKSEVEFKTSSGRRVKRRNLDERDGTLSMKVRKKRRKGRFGLRRKSSKSASLRPQRRAARNALTYFSRINGASTDVEEEDESETDSSENDSLPPELDQSNESDRSIQDIQQKYKRDEELSLDECDSVGPSQINEPRLNPGIRRLVLKLPARASKKAIPPEKLESGYPEQDDMMGVSTIPEKVDLNATGLKPPESATCSVDMAIASVAENGGETRSRVGGQDDKYVERPDLSAGFKDRRIKWGEVKARSSKRLRLEDSSIMDGHVNPDGHNDLEDKINGHFKLEDEYERTSFECGSRAQEDNPDHDAHKNENQFVDAAEKCHDGGRNKDLNVEYVRQPSTNVKALPDDCQQGVASSVPRNGIISAENLCANDGYRDHKGINESLGHNDFCERDEMLVNNKITPEKHQGIGKNAQPPIYRRLRIKSRGFAPRSPSEKLKSVGATDDPRSSLCDLLSDSSMQIGRNVDEGEGSSEQQSPEHDDDSKGKMVVVQTEDLKIVHPNSTNYKMYNAVYRRSKSYRDRNCFGNDIHAMEESTSNSNSQNERPNLDFPEADLDVRRTRSMNTRMASSQWKPAVSDFRLKEDHGSAGTSRVRGEELKSSCKMVVGLRSSRNRRGNYDLSDSDCGNRRRIKPSAKKLSWLMLLEHEEWYRYIPQLGDEVAYLKQGHQEYLEHCRSQEVGPWRMFNGSLRTVEFCRVIGLDYSQVPGSGESCCKLTLEFTDPSSSVFGKIFKMTLPELRDFSDFLVERTRYDVAMERNWTHRDKCQVWWRDDEGDGGSWYDGRVVQGKPKSSELSDSPWLRCVVQYKNDGSGHHTHCPWELRDPGGQWEHPHIDNEIRQKLLSSLAKIEQNASKHDYYGILKLKQVAQKSDYINRFPVPLSLEAIKRRLENNYYRTLDAVDHDIRVMLLNAESYFGRNAEYAMKIRRLGDWLTRTLSSL